MPSRSKKLVSSLALVIFFTCTVAAHPCYAQAEATCVSDKPLSAQRRQSDRGIITVGCPKIWVSDRIFSVLDGLLRDVDSITLKNLQGLDPNSVTGADLLSIASEFEANVKYDQGAAVANAFALQKANAQRNAELQQYDTQQKTNQLVLQQQETLTERFVSLQQQDYQLASAGKGADDPKRSSIAKEETLINDQLNALKQLPSSTGTSGSTPGSSISDPNIASNNATQATAASTSLTALDQNALQQAFGNVLQSPKLPAAMQMDNVIDLLRQRLAREFAVTYDDLSREADKYDLYLAQFDVGLIPGTHGKKEHPMVQISLNGNQAIAYDLFPVGAAYNTTTGLAKTSRIGITGAAQTLFGFGLSGAYSHSRSEYRSSLTQTLYVSGFGAGTSRFGWVFGTAPFENFVSPGSRSVYAILLVPKRGTETPIASSGTEDPSLTMTVTTCWLKEGRSRASDCVGRDTAAQVKFSLPTPADPKHPSQQLAVLSYQPYYQHTIPSTGGGAPAPNQPTSNTVQLVFTEPIDPNMTITVNDKILRRVRDVRGRALYAPADSKPDVLAGNSSETSVLSKSRFGILESDTLQDDTWFQVNSKAVLLNISKDTAGTDVFPTIRVSDPRSGGRDVFEMAADQTNLYPTQTRIAEWDFTPKTLNGVRAAFAPLFTEPYDPGRVAAYVDQTTAAGTQAEIPAKVRIMSETRRPGRRSPVWLHAQAQVVLEADADHWALDCNGDEGTLECSMPLGDEEYVKDASHETQLKLWVDEPPYYERPGLWADTDLHPMGHVWKAQPYVMTDWSGIHEVHRNFGVACQGGKCNPQLPWNAWEATITAKNLDVNGASAYCIAGLPNTDLLSSTEKELQQKSAQTRNFALQGEVTRVRNLLRMSAHPPLIEVRGMSDIRNKSNSHDYGQTTSPPDCAVSPVLTEQTPSGDSIALTIPFDAFPYLQNSISLKCIGVPSCQDITLPDLKNALLPGPVTLTPLGDGGYRIEGDHLQAVTALRLVRDANAYDFNAVPGINNVDFFVPASKKLAAGLYEVYLVLNEVPVAASYGDTQKTLHPLTLSMAAEGTSVAKAESVNGNQAKPAPSQTAKKK